MNRSLLKDSLKSELPERIDDYLEGGKALVMQYNWHGNILAAGTAEGAVVLWDFDTRSIAKHLVGHGGAVTSISFPMPQTGQKLISGAWDCTLRFWDVLAGQSTVHSLDSRVLQLEASPTREDEVVVVTVGEAPRVLLWAEASTEAMEAAGGQLKTTIRQQLVLEHAEDGPLDAKKKQEFVAVYNKQGTAIIRGGGQGILRLFELERKDDQLRIASSKKVELPSKTLVKEIVFAHDGSRFLVNSADRYIRVFDAENLCVMASFTDVVNRSQWKCAIFSGDGGYILGGSSGAEHKLHIWRLVDSQLEKTLDGPKEGIGGLLWHPKRPVVVSLGVYGGIYVWTKSPAENWAAFAPNFTQIDENQEYDEREDEFDIPDPEVEKQKLEEKLKREELIVVDVTTVDETDSDDVPVFYLPAIPEQPLEPLIPVGYLEPIVKKPKVLKESSAVRRKP